MKANYKVIANKQKILEKEIENFEPTSTMSVLLMRYSIIQGLLQVKVNEKDENGIPNISPVDMAYEMTTFFGDAVNAAADDFTNDDEDDSTIKFDGTVDEFRQELANRVLITLSLAFEHEFINFTEQTGISRAQYEILAAEYIAHAEDDGSKISEMFKGDSSEKHKSKGWTSTCPKTNEVKNSLARMCEPTKIIIA